MTPDEHAFESFVVRVWMELDDEAARRWFWRGRITHVPSGHDAALQDFEDIRVFMQPYLHRMDERARRLP